jgi:hypothetical protein
MRYIQKLLPVFVIAVAIIPDFSRAQNGYAVTERGADYRVLQKTTIENGTNYVHQYTELATGLNYTNSYGQWTESKEEIDILPNGTAAAVQGQHKVYFPADIYDGVLEVVTPDGRHLKSRPLGVSYDDGSNTVFIATLTNSIGVLTASNQVTYPNAFTDIKADLVCTYRKSGFECDLVFREKPPTPDQYGLDPDTSTLQLVTEFFNTQDPQQIPAGYDEWYGLQDDTLKFGKLTMTHGKAFVVGNPRPSAGRGQGEGKVSVYKRWLHLAGRTFLIEELPLVDLADDLSALPEATNALTRISNPAARLQKFASNHRQMPPSHELVSDLGKIQIASADLNKQPGVVLDYDEIDSGTTDDYTFYADTTYFISGPVAFGGNVTFEGGTVVKYPNDNTAYIEIDLSVTCPSVTDRPAIFTAADDDSVGESMNGVWAGYSGTISGYYANPALTFATVWTMYSGQGPVLNNLRIQYAQEAISAPAETEYDQPVVLSNSQIFNCSDAIDLTSSWDNQVTLDNCLITNVNNVAVTYNYDGTYDYYYFSHCTVDNCSQLVNDVAYPQDEVISPTNSIFSNIGNWIGVPFGSPSDFGWGEDNGFYNTPDTLRGDNSTVITSSPYQTAGSANYYLTLSSPFHGIGTTDIDGYLLAEIQAMTTYAPQDGGWLDTNGTDLGYHYFTNEDSDFDSLPDWWEYKWFGNYNQTGSETDVNGNTFLSDYENGTDPSITAFWLSMTNMYLNTNQTSVRINLQGGWPFYVAVLVNETNYADADWQPYTGTNIAVTLGTTDGNYNVWVGLRGLPADSQPVWDTGDISFTLDRMPPVLTITNPVIVSGAATVIKPYLQLQGCGDENLLSLSYDISNATGVFSNLDGFVTDKFFDTNKFDFTTNFFQCYDIALTNGLNLITLHATDFAGNTTTTNLSITLDYTTATNPPVIQLIWPQDGMLVSGTNFYLRGLLNDETAAVMAQVVDTNGDTNVVTGIVERNGMFWAEKLPLTNGDNAVTVTATDAAGNVSVTNFTVTQSSLALTIDSTPTEDDLYKTFGSVGGTVGDASATVTVNGTAATVDAEANDDGTYDWSADNAPIYGRGTATFDATANVSGGASANASSAVEMGPYWAVEEHETTKSMTTFNEEGVNVYDIQDQKHYSAKVQPDGSGNWRQTYTGTLHDDYFYIYDDHYVTDVQWSDSNGGSYVETDGEGEVFSYPLNEYSGFGNYNGPGEIESVPDEDTHQEFDDAPTIYVYHYFAKGVDWPLSNAVQNVAETKVDAHTQVKLYTGGKAQIQRQNLFGIYVSANAYGKPEYAPWHYTAGEPLDITSTTVMGRHPGADHMVWKLLPDGFDGEDMTVTAPAKHYDASAGGAKYHCYFNAYADQPNPGGGRLEIFSFSSLAGHAWWCLTSDAPIEAFTYLNLDTSLYYFIGGQAGYFPKNRWTAGLIISGELRYPNGGEDVTAFHNFNIGFNDLIGGLNYTKNIYYNPGIYTLFHNNCTTQTVKAGAAANVNLPKDWNPQNFGIDLDKIPPE